MSILLLGVKAQVKQPAVPAPLGTLTLIRSYGTRALLPHLTGIAVDVAILLIFAILIYFFIDTV
jgi:hypothetical protein